MNDKILQNKLEFDALTKASMTCKKCYDRLHMDEMVRTVCHERSVIMFTTLAELETHCRSPNVNANLVNAVLAEVFDRLEARWNLKTTHEKESWGSTNYALNN
jgi:predicted metallopeptidase